jgi:CheY-like chemotaxis protein
MLGYALHHHGYEVLFAQNGLQGLDIIEKQNPDLLLLDIMMPDMDGYEVCRRIRANPKTRHLPIMMLTAKAQMEDKLAGFEIGADDYLAKPITMAELLARIKALLLRSSYGPPTSVPKARTVAFLGAKGGVGTTTLAINTGIALIKHKQSAALVELRPWGGAAAKMLGLTCPTNLVELAKREAAQITPTAVREALVAHASGLGLLPAPTAYVSGKDQPDLSASKVVKIIQSLQSAGKYLLLDLGTGMPPGTVAALEQCDYTFLVTEQSAISLKAARETLAGLATLALTGNQINLVVNNRSRMGISVVRTEIESAVGTRSFVLIAPSPESLFHADREGSAVVLMQPDSSFAQSIDEMVQFVT